MPPSKLFSKRILFVVKWHIPGKVIRHIQPFQGLDWYINYILGYHSKAFSVLYLHKINGTNKPNFQKCFDRFSISRQRNEMFSSGQQTFVGKELGRTDSKNVYKKANSVFPRLNAALE